MSTSFLPRLTPTAFAAKFVCRYWNNPLVNPVQNSQQNTSNSSDSTLPSSQPENSQLLGEPQKPGSDGVSQE
jgi:hypothetical protein